MRVLRLCSVFEPPDSAIVGKGVGFDPIGGMQSHTADLTRALDRHGVAQIVVTTRPPTAPHLQRLGAHAKIIRLGLPLRQFRQFYSLPAAVLVPALAGRVDLIHAHLGEDLAVLPLAASAARLHHLPMVVTVHTSLRHTLPVRDVRSAILKIVGGRIESWGEHRAAAVVAITPRLARQLVTGGVDPGRVHLIPPGVNPAQFAGPHDDPFPGVARPRVLFLGRLAPQKGVRTLVATVAHIQTPGVQVLLVGDGPERPALEALIASGGLGDRVHIHGFVPHQRVPAVLAHADLVVLPSVYEELGKVLIEAMTVGTPVVASRTGGIPDVVTDGVNGILVPVGDPLAVAAAIDRVLGDPSLAARLVAAGREHAQSYDWNSLAARILDIYQDVLRAPGGGITSS